jgi:hypothetical protein
MATTATKRGATKRKPSTTSTVGRKPMPAADQQAIVREIVAMLDRYAPPLVVRRDTKGGYNYVSEKDLVIDGRKRSEVYFASVIPQKDYVGFYYMPVYAEPDVKALFSPELLGLLKGKSCFHIKAMDKSLAKEIRAALASGYKMYKQRGWV